MPFLRGCAERGVLRPVLASAGGVFLANAAILSSSDRRSRPGHASRRPASSPGLSAVAAVAFLALIAWYGGRGDPRSAPPE